MWQHKVIVARGWNHGYWFLLVIDLHLDEVMVVPQHFHLHLEAAIGSGVSWSLVFSITLSLLLCQNGASSKLDGSIEAMLGLKAIVVQLHVRVDNLWSSLSIYG